MCPIQYISLGVLKSMLCIGIMLISTSFNKLMYFLCIPHHPFCLIILSGRNVGKVFNPVVKLVLENQPFLMPEPAEKPSLQLYFGPTVYVQYISC